MVWVLDRNPMECTRQSGGEAQPGDGYGNGVPRRRCPSEAGGISSRADPVDLAPQALDGPGPAEGDLPPEPRCTQDEVAARGASRFRGITALTTTHTRRLMANEITAM